MVKREKEPKQPMLDDDPSSIEASVELNALALKQNIWNIKLVIGAVLPTSYHQYDAKLLFNEEPYLEQIKDIEHELEAGLFSEERGTKVQANKEIARIKEKMEKKKEECETIAFIGIVNEIKWGDAKTIVAMNIPDNVIDSISKHRLIFGSYKISLTPIF